jgi:hypothetical protein
MPSQAAREAERHAAGVVPECFRFDDRCVSVYLNVNRSLLGGTVVPHEEEVTYADNRTAVINQDLDIVRVAPLCASAALLHVPRR